MYSVKATTKDAYKLLHDGSLALSKVEANGLRIDVKYLQHTERQLAEEIKQLERELKKDEVWKVWRKAFGGEANLISRTQLGTILFATLKYPCSSYTATKKPQANEAALEKVKIPFAQKYLRMQKLLKAKNTYIKGILRETVDGYLHPSFSLHLVQTFRSSSQQPNFHNIPIRNPEIKKLVRRAFIPRKGG